MSLITVKASTAINNTRFLFVLGIVCLHCRIDQDIVALNAPIFIKYFCNFNLSQDFICRGRKLNCVSKEKNY